MDRSQAGAIGCALEYGLALCHNPWWLIVKRSKLPRKEFIAKIPG